MFPISSTTLSGPNPANLPLVSPTTAVNSVNSSTIAPVGSAIDAPAQASVQVDLSPVANFLLTVSQSREQITQLQAAVVNGADPQEAAARATALNDATQNVVNAFNLLPGVEFNQAQPQGPSLLNNLVESLNRQTFGANASQQPNQANQPNQPQSAAQSLAQSLSRIGVTLQPPLLSDAAAGLSLDNEILRASFNTDNQSTTNTLQNTFDTFSELATRFAEQLSAAGSAARPALASAQQDALTPEDLVANARLDLARAELDLLRQVPLQDTAADRLAAQRAELEQPLTPRATSPDSPIVNPLQASTADVIAAQNAEAREAGTREADINALPSQQSQTAQSLPAAGQVEQNQAADASQENQAASNASTERSAAQTASDAAQATAAAQALAQAQAAQSAADVLAAQSAEASAVAAQARAALAAATTPEAANAAGAIAAQQAAAAQTTAGNLAAANAAAADAQQQARAAQVAAVQASTVQTNPLQGNPALAAAIAAYNISDPALLGANARAAQATVSATPRVSAVTGPARTRGIGPGQ